MTENWNKLLTIIPTEPFWHIHWDGLMETPLYPYILDMQATQQNPRWHSEGDVWTHTQMVCEGLAKDEAFRKLDAHKRMIVFIAGLLHDIGKTRCTRLENNAWVSPNHAVIGAKIVRELLWRDFGLSGTPETQNIRECICTLIRYHSVPLRFFDQTNSDYQLIKIAAQEEVIPNFSLALLKVLVMADMNGRICKELDQSIETVELCFLSAEELGIMNNPYPFPSVATKYAYLSGKKIWRDQELYDDTWGEVILLCAMPGTGKDTWIRANCVDMPMVSLDEIRKTLDIAPTKPQGAVVNEGKERAKKLLRAHMPFVWNATNTTMLTRNRLISLFERYHASVKIVFLETAWETEIERNQNRSRIVPQRVIDRMLRNLEVPKVGEAQYVEWLCV